MTIGLTPANWDVVWAVMLTSPLTSLLRNPARGPPPQLVMSELDPDRAYPLAATPFRLVAFPAFVALEAFPANETAASCPVDGLKVSLVLETLGAAPPELVVASNG